MKNYGAVGDFETRSRSDLTEVGAYKYSLESSTDIICFGFKWRGRKALVTKDNPRFIPKLFKAWYDSGELFSAHNAFFERSIYENVMVMRHGWPEIPLSRYNCSAAIAAAHALPRPLEKLCQALKTKHQKDMVGNRLMKKYMKPRRPSKNNPNEWFDDERDFKRIYEYCLSDLDAEEEVLQVLPGLNPSERKIWLLDQTMNWQGLELDAYAVENATLFIEYYRNKFTGRLHEITNHEVNSVKQNVVFKEYLNYKLGANLPDLKAQTVVAALEDETISDEVRELLWLRQVLSKSSVDKYTAMKARLCDDDRVRDNLMYHGASTGRWSGTGLQIQNFPKGKIRDPELVLQCLMEKDPEKLEMLYGDPFVALSAALRSMIVASEGKEFFVGDFNAIEARVLFWLSGDALGLKSFDGGVDAYRTMAALIYGIKEEDVTPEQRDVGKAAFLGAGFQMGVERFEAHCKSYNIKGVDKAVSEAAIYAYRNRFKKVPEFWENLEQACIAAVRKNKSFKTRHLKIFVEGRFLYIQLPSGRRIAYCDPKVEMTKTKWGTEKMSLTYWAVNPKTKQWVKEHTYGGKLAENVVQGTASDFLRESMKRLGQEGYEMRATIHDENLTERDLGTGNLERFTLVMSEVPKWGLGCPISVKSWQGTRYRKG